MTTLADGTRVVRQTDGIEITTRPDETIIHRFPDGTRIESRPDGTQLASYPDHVHITTHPDGTRIEKWPDGTQITTRPDNTVITQHRDGTHIESRPDGTEFTTRPDNTVFARDPDGTLFFRDRDGIEITTRADGTREARWPHGLETITWPDDTVFTRYPDGTTILRRPDGIEFRTQPDGTGITLYPDGTIVTVHPDGTEITTRSDGTRTVRRPDEVKPADKTAKKGKTEKGTKDRDLSGAWIASGELGGLDREWRIAHIAQDGTIRIFVPITYLPGRALEFTGTIKDGAIRATYRITDPDVVHPKRPERIRLEYAKRSTTVSLRLKVGKEGNLEGACQCHWSVSSNEPPRITGGAPGLFLIRLVRKAEQPILATPTKPSAEKKPGVKGPPEPEDAKEQETRARLAEEAQRRADELTRIAEQATREAREAEQREREAREEVDRPREEARRRWVEATDAAREANRLLDRARWRSSVARQREEVWGRRGNDPDDPQVIDAKREAEAAYRVFLLRTREWERARSRAEQAYREYNTMVDPAEPPPRLAQARREAAEARERARNAFRAAFEARRGADKLRAGLITSSDPLPESTRTPVTPQPSPPVVNP